MTKNQLNKNIIMLHGKKRSGKDYTANLLKTELEAKGKTVKVMAIAEPMKQIIATTFGISLEQLEVFKNNSNSKIIDICELYSTDFRKVLQLFGTEAMKPIFGKNVWVKLLTERVNQSRTDCIIISDWRFLEEYEHIVNTQTKNKIYTVKILGSDDSSDNHSSEQNLNINFDWNIDNSKKNNNINEQVKQFVLLIDDLNDY